MRSIMVTEEMIRDRVLDPDKFYYPESFRRFIRAGAAVDEPGEYWESDFIYTFIEDDYKLMCEIDKKVSSGVIEGCIDGYGFKRVANPVSGTLTYEVRITPPSK